MSAMTTGQPRLSKRARRDQLLDTAAALLVESGGTSLTMEGLAAAAGVSKALPYTHFANSDDVEAQLYQREITDLGEAVVTAMSGLARGRAQVEAAIAAYFGFVEERGAVLSVLSTRPAVTSTADPELGPSFVAELVASNFDIDHRRAKLFGELMLGALMAATTMWARGAATRAVAQDVSVEFILGALKSARRR